MQILVMVLVVMGALVVTVGGVMFLIAAFRESVLWGLAVMFLPIANTVFLFMYWSEAKRAFLVQLLGCVVMFGAIGVAFAAGVSQGVSTAAVRAMESEGIPISQIAPLALAEPDEGEENESEPIVLSEGETFVGMQLSDVRKELGWPKGKLETETKTIYFYDGIEIISTDGITVSRELVVTVDETEEP